VKKTTALSLFLQLLPFAAAPALAADKPMDIVDVAAASKDHSTLVTAVKAADLVRALKNPGPLTVFAPTNAAFDKLPKGTVEGLLQPEKKEALAKILQYHVTTSVYQIKDLKDGMTLGAANGGKVKVHVKDGKVTINDAAIVGTVSAWNGIVHVIDTVLLPPPPTAPALPGATAAPAAPAAPKK
jgi:uncharacterized surface protein with fasciclin (FAS1) repeats